MSGDVVIESDEIDWRTQSPGGNFEAFIKDLTDSSGLEQLGLRLYKINPGKTAWPFHAHTANEEVIFIQDGEGTLRIGEERKQVSAGDVLCFPTDPNCPHQLINDSDEILRYLSVSTMIEPEAIVYPDSNKIGVLAGEPPGGDSEERTIDSYLDANASYDYWDGEIED
jgi:uncharacterized cupin superfamily protein